MPLAGRRGVKGFSREIPTKPSCLSKMRMLDCKTARELLRSWKPSSNLALLHLLSTAVVVMGPKKTVVHSRRKCPISSLNQWEVI